ncbi:MAG: hypothetical protein A3F68_12765 [Acidobacteria bacterium RIFCSPLOWO2_12_FULL_54_10]|nr:MAG: hypothetical protein A3F68_12765 [Acidobacteria bacterium RIFCSPLOWO2_12_FULL_54_10]
MLVCALAIGLFLILLPSVFMGQDKIYVQAELSPQLLLGLLVLVMFSLVYLIHKQFQVRNLRLQSIQDAWNFELGRVQMLIDPLTQVFNRAALEEIFSKEINRAKRNQSSLFFLYIDVDDFKHVNTKYGHLAGDLVLTEVGAILKQSIRGSDYVIRMGGDEFLLALVDTNDEGAQVVKNRVHQSAINWSQSSPLAGYKLSLSIGVKKFDGSMSFDKAMEDADALMYAEKEKHHSD